MTKSSEQAQPKAQPNRHIVNFLVDTLEHDVLYLPGWYFYDEAYHLHGPFSSWDEVSKAFDYYVVGLEGERD